MSKRMIETQIVSILKEEDAGIPAKKLCRKYGIASSTFIMRNVTKTVWETVLVTQDEAIAKLDPSMAVWKPLMSND